MNQKKTSKEELYLSKLYELASAKGNPQAEVDRYKVGEANGVNNKAIDNIVQVLTKNGLIWKSDGKMIHLTDFGLRFVKENLSP